MSSLVPRPVALLTVSLLVLGVGAAVGSAPALAATVCPTDGSTSWINAAGGDWDTPGNWSNGVPSGSCSVSITLAGTYTVTDVDGGSANDLTLGASAGTQILQIAGSTTVGGQPQEQIFSVGPGNLTVGTHGVLEYTAVGSNPGGITSTGAATIMNSGLVRTVVGDGAGNRDIQNNVTNNPGGVVALHTDTNTCGCGNTHTWANSGTISTDPGTTSTFTGTAAGVLFTQSTGTFTNNGRAEVGGGYTITGGTTTGNPIEVCGFVNAPGAGAAKFEFDSLPDINCGNGGSGSLTGDVGAATSVRIHSDTSGVSASVSPAITNHGTITFDGGPGQGQLNGQAVTNAGTLNLHADATAPSTHITSALTNSGALDLAAGTDADFASKFTQSGGTVAVGAGSTFSANNNMDLSGGTITNSGVFTAVGQLNHTGGSTSGQPIELCGGNLNAQGPGSAKFVLGRIANCSSMALDGDIGTGDKVRIESAGPQLDVSEVSLTNHGTLTVVSDPTHLVQLHSGVLTNDGTFNTTGSNFPVSGIVNQGMWNVAALGGVNTNVNSAVTLTGGSLNVAGTLNANGVSISGGVLQGTGTVATTSGVTNTGGTVHPGNSPGVLSITGDYTQGSGGTLTIAVRGSSVGSGYSRLAVSGNAALDGKLHVTTSVAQRGPLRVVTAASRTGVFASKLFTGQKTSVSYNATGVSLTAIKPVATAVPTVHGTVTVGRTLTSTHGTFTGQPTSYAYQWLRCSSSGTRCVSIHGARASTHRVVAGDAGHRLRVRVKATAIGGHATATSRSTSIVRKAK